MVWCDLRVSYFWNLGGFIKILQMVTFGPVLTRDVKAQQINASSGVMETETLMTGIPMKTYIFRTNTHVCDLGNQTT